MGELHFENFQNKSLFKLVNVKPKMILGTAVREKVKNMLRIKNFPLFVKDFAKSNEKYSFVL